MTIKELCAVLHEDAKIIIGGMFEDVAFPRSEDFLMDSLGNYEIDCARPTGENEITVFLKIQYVKRSN